MAGDGRISVLLVDDDPHDRELFGSALLRSKEADYEVTTAATAALALQRWHERRFDCLIVDHGLPGQDGLEFLSELRGEFGLPAAVVVLTGRDSPDLARDCLAAGAHEYLVKGLSAHLLLPHVVSNALVRFERESHRVQAQDRQFRSFFEDSPLPMWVYSPHTLQFLAVNQAACALYGWSREEFLAMTLLDIRTPDEQCRLLDYFGASAGRSTARHVWRHQRQDGSRIEVEIGSHETVFAGTPARWVVVLDVTERRQAERQVRLLAAAVRDSQDSIIITDAELDAPGPRIVFLNEAFTRMTGYTAAEVLGRTPRLLQGPATDRQVQARLKADLRAGRVSRGETINYRKDGTPFHMEWQITGVSDESGRTTHYVATQRDVTEERRRQAQLAESEARFRTLANAAPVMIWISGPDLQCHWVNESWLRFTGRTPAEELGHGWADLVHPDDRETVQAGYVAPFNARQPVIIEFRARRHDGEWRWLLSHGVPRFEADGAFAGYIGSSIDTTERKRLEERLGQSAKMEAVGRLAGGVAHDFNNLLHVIRGNLELHEMEHGRLSAELATVRQAADRAVALTQQLLAFSRQQPQRITTVDLNRVIADTQRLLARVIGEDIRLCQVPAPEPVPVRADAAQIEQVLLNLAVNARDAMPQGGTLTFRVRTAGLPPEHACQHNLPPGRYAVLSVTDTGAGMSAAIVKRIFEPFFTTKPAGQGTGLGLAIVYGIVQQSHGTIEVESTPGAGTAFHLWLPLTTAPAALAPAPAAQPGPGAGQQRTILLVEDEPEVRRLLVRMLDRGGYRVLDAASGAAALHLLRAGEPVDLLVTDVIMPEMDGYRVAAAVRQLRPSLPVLYLSAHTDHAALNQALADGTAAFLAKPCGQQQLLAKLAECLAGTLV